MRELLSSHENLKKEWMWDKNIDIDFYKITGGSGIYAWWRCSKCSHEWKAKIANRTYGFGCPVCAGNIVHKGNRLINTHPEIIKDFHYFLNKNIVISNIAYGSDRKIWWICRKCGYEWRASPNKRTSDNTGCPTCSGQVVWDYNSLLYLCKRLISEWDYSKNKIGPGDVSCGSGKKVWWECPRCNHSWKTNIYHRVGNDRGCPKCYLGQISKISQEWLDFINIKNREQKLYINGRLLKIDGFENNIVYEFLGDFWHGNPELYNPEDVNPMNKKKYGDLYKKTMERISLLEQAGYTVIYIWEKDWLDIRRNII